MDAALTLVSFFRKFFAPLFFDDARPRTFIAYEETLRHWRRITGDPELPCGAVVLAAFKVELHKTLSAATVNKHLRQVNAILGKCGPAGPGNRDTLGMIDATAWTRPLREDRVLPRSIGDGVVSTIYTAARFARWPKCEAAIGWAAAWWRCCAFAALPPMWPY